MSSPPIGEEPLAKNQKKNPCRELPNDLLMSCFARVSRLHYQTLSFVSKSFRSLLASPELYVTRSLLHRTESCLYVCLRFGPNSDLRWFTLCRKPDRTNTSKKSICNLLFSIPPPNEPRVRWSGLQVVAVGSDVYNIGGTIADAPSSSVLILDCRSHLWREGPRMLMTRDHPAAGVLDGKIYVAGGCRDFDSPSWIEVLDPKKEAWIPVSSSCAKDCGSEIIASTEIDGKLFMYGCKGVAYNPQDGKCEPVEWDMCKGWAWFSYCVIDNVLYYYHDGEFKWFDTSIRAWKTIKGLNHQLLNFASYSHVKLADYGGKMAVLWDMYADDSGVEGKEIWCAEIAIETSNTGDIWGKVEWVDAVLKVPDCYEFVRVLAVTV